MSRKIAVIFTCYFSLNSTIVCCGALGSISALLQTLGKMSMPEENFLGTNW